MPKLLIKYNAKDRTANVRYAGSSVGCRINASSAAEAKYIAEKSFAHQSYLNYLAKRPKVNYEGNDSFLNMGSIDKLINCAIRTIQFRAFKIFGMSLDDSIALANYVISGQTIKYMEMGLCEELIGDIKEVETMRRKGRLF